MTNKIKLYWKIGSHLFFENFQEIKSTRYNKDTVELEVEIDPGELNIENWELNWNFTSPTGDVEKKYKNKISNINNNIAVLLLQDDLTDEHGTWKIELVAKEPSASGDDRYGSKSSITYEVIETSESKGYVAEISYEDIPPSTVLTDKGVWATGTNYSANDFVHDEASDPTALNSMWVCYTDAYIETPSTTQPKDDSSNWIEWMAAQGKSAYEVWLSEGNAGTEQDFLDSLKSDEGNVTIPVRNSTGQLITKGSAVFVDGAIGQTATIQLSNASSISTAKVSGVIVGDIDNNSFGELRVLGEVDRLDTSTYAEGAFLYLSEVAGELTDIEPGLPVRVALVTYQNPAQGRVIVKGMQKYLEGDDIFFNNLGTSITSNDVEGAIKELESRIVGLEQ